MDSLWHMLGVSILQMSLVVLMSSRSLSSPLAQRKATSDLWPMAPSAAAGKSHLLMWVRTEKQLMPLVTSLADSALDLLLCQCKAAGYTELMTECLEYAADLNDTQPLPGFPSAMALRAENQKHFAKVLIEDVVVAMHSLEHLMAPLAENLKQCHLQDKFLPSLRLANRQFGNMVKSFYNSNLKDAKVPTTKRVSTGQSGVQVPIKALYNTYNRLKLIESVLGYYLDLSWFSRLESLAKEKKTLASQGE